ncbi:nSTAND1 domain-containing NTPase [Streptomyces sp. NPDC004457]
MAGDGEPDEGGGLPDDERHLAGAGEPSVPASVFQVLAPDGRVAGAGFLAGEDTGFTCAHVVRAAGQSPGGRVEVRFPHLPGAPRLMADVVSEQWRAPEAEDVALLRPGPVPAGARPLAVGASAGCRGHGFFSFGFPAQALRGGHFGYGEVGGLLPGDGGAGRQLQLTKANDLTTGFSGAPVVDEMTGLVIGMVSSIVSPDIHGKGVQVAYATPAEVLRQVQPRLTEHQACPYLGLKPFTTRHADWFHGRGTAVERVLAALRGNRRMVMLLGPSGAGKTSLVHAGVLPALARGAIPGSDRWLPLSARPGRDLLTELEGAGLPGAATDGLVAAAEARRADEPGHDRLLLVVDQFEELLTQPAPPVRQRADDGRLRAVDQLLELAGSHVPVTVLVVMRNDFYAPLAALAPDLMNAVLPGLCNVPATLSRGDLLAIITRPAAAVGLPLETDLADRIVEDVLAADPEARQAPVTLLPPLELALRHLWTRRRREDGKLTHAAYERIGRVTGSLTDGCNHALGQLPAAQRPVARRILTALVRPADEDNGIPATRQPVPLGRLRALAADPAADPAAGAAFDDVLAALTRHRIITTDISTRPGAPRGEPAAELIHDALVRDWADLRDWVARDHQFQVWLRRATEQHKRHARSGLPGDLLDGSLLAEGEEWAGQRSLPDEIVSLLEASRQHQQSAMRRTRRVNAALAAVLVLALIATGVAWAQRQTVIGQRDRAASAQVAGIAQSVRHSDPRLARRLAVASARLADTPESWSALLALRNQREEDVLRLPGFVVTTANLDRAGRTLVAAGGDRVGFWNVDTRRRIGSYSAPAKVLYATLSADGETAAVSTGDGNTRLIDVSRARPRDSHVYPSARDVHQPRVAVSPHGTYLLIEGITAGKPTMTVWDTRTAKKVITTTGSDFPVWSTSFSPDERVLSLPVAHGRGQPFTWLDTRTRKKIPVPDLELGADDVPSPIVFSPDGKHAAFSAKGGRIRVFDLAGGYFSAELTGGDDPSVYPVSFSRDGRYIAQGGNLWDTASSLRLDPVMRYSTTDSECYSDPGPQFTADDSELRCVGTDGAVRSLDITPFTKVPEGTGEFYREGVVSGDRRTLALVHDGDIEIRSRLSGTRRLTVTSGASEWGGAVDKIQLSHDGRLLAVHTYTRLEVWDIADDAGKRKATLLGRVPVVGKDRRSGAFIEFAFSPDDKSLAVQVATQDGTNALTFWNLAGMRRVRDVRAGLGYPDDGAAVVFQPDGKSVIAAPNLGRVAFPSGRIVTRGTPSMEVDAISDDGRTLYTYPRAFRPYIRSWNASTLLPDGDDLRTGPVASPLSAPERATAVSPDGRLFATVHESGTGYETKVWDSRTGTQLGVPLTASLDEIVALAFTPDGSALTSVDRYGRTVTHTIAPARLVRDLCDESGPLTASEWRTHIPDIPYRRTC